MTGGCSSSSSWSSTSSACRSSTNFCCSRIPFSYVTRCRLRKSQGRIAPATADRACAAFPYAARRATSSPLQLREQFPRLARDVGIDGVGEQALQRLARGGVLAAVHLGDGLVVGADLAVGGGDLFVVRGLLHQVAGGFASPLRGGGRPECRARLVPPALGRQLPR